MDSAKSFPPDKEAPRAADKPVKPPDRKPAKIHLPSAVTTRKHPRRPLAAMLYELIAVVSVPLGFVFFWNVVCANALQVRPGSLHEVRECVSLPLTPLSAIPLEVGQRSLTIY